jgi:hypothetical protein
MTASFHHDGRLAYGHITYLTWPHHFTMMEALVQYNLFNMTTSFHHDGSLGPYNLFNMTTSFHHDGSLEPYNLFNPSMMGPLGHTTCLTWLHHFTMMGT